MVVRLRHVGMMGDFVNLIRARPAEPVAEFSSIFKVGKVHVPLPENRHGKLGIIF